MHRKLIVFILLFSLSFNVEVSTEACLIMCMYLNDNTFNLENVNLLLTFKILNLRQFLFVHNALSSVKSYVT